jgi:hypothetical protein
VHRLIAVLDRDEVVHALDRMKRRRTLRRGIEPRRGEQGGPTHDVAGRHEVVFAIDRSAPQYRHRSAP